MSNMFRPTTDDTNDDGFLPDTLENLRKAATPVPLIIGFNNKEGRMAFQSNRIMHKIQLRINCEDLKNL